MKRNMRRLSALLAAVLILACVPLGALAEGAAESGAAEQGTAAVAYNLWVVAKSGATIYRDAQLSQKWLTLSEDALVNLYAYRGGCAVLRNGDQLAYIATGDLDKLQAGTKLCARQNTRVYEAASLDSRYVNVKSGLDVEVVEVRGSCAKVKRDGHTGYMYIGHLQLIPDSRAV